MSQSGRVRAAIIGAGLMGYWHADAVARNGAEVGVVVDRVARRAEALAARYPGAKVLDLQEAVNDASIDVVHVCTPIQTHVSFTVKALQAGRHVLVEKPLAQTHDETVEVLKLARERQRLVCPVHQFLFQSGFLQAERAARRIGPVLYADAFACSAGVAGAAHDQPDRLLGDVLPHPLAMLERLFPGRLARADWQVVHPRVGEMRAATTLAESTVGLLISAHGRPQRMLCD